MSEPTKQQIAQATKVVDEALAAVADMPPAGWYSMACLLVLKVSVKIETDCGRPWHNTVLMLAQSVLEHGSAEGLDQS